MYTKTIGDLSYKIYDNYAAVWKSDKNTSTVIVPTEVEGKSVTEIGNSAFDGCTSLKKITIPDSVTEIGHGAFYGCTSLKEITIPNSITEIGNYAFWNCTALNSIILPNSITKISSYIFDGCESLSEMTIPDNIKKIDKTAFKNCPNIQKVKFSQALINRTDSKKIFEQMINAGLCTYEVIFKEPVL